MEASLVVLHSMHETHHPGEISSPIVVMASSCSKWAAAALHGHCMPANHIAGAGACCYAAAGYTLVYDGVPPPTHVMLRRSPVRPQYQIEIRSAPYKHMFINSTDNQLPVHVGSFNNSAHMRMPCRCATHLMSMCTLQLEVHASHAVTRC